MFFSHVRSDRILRHYRRLVEETQGLLDWRFVFNPGRLPAPEFAYADPALCMPARFDQAVRNGGMPGGYLDTALIPCVLAIDADFTWVVEYDVDFSGNWANFFEQFDGNPGDLLTTSITPRSACPRWHWWRTAKAPPQVSPERMIRGFNPVFRVSKRLARVYQREMANSGWEGHYEFTLPTVAALAELQLQDIGGSRPNAPETWAASNYVNDPLHPRLAPGTLRWRPAQQFYFHERPTGFKLPNKLYHPIKADVGEWEKAARRA